MHHHIYQVLGVVLDRKELFQVIEESVKQKRPDAGLGVQKLSGDP